MSFLGDVEKKRSGAVKASLNTIYLFASSGTLMNADCCGNFRTFPRPTTAKVRALLLRLQNKTSTWMLLFCHSSSFFFKYQNSWQFSLIASSLVSHLYVPSKQPQESFSFIDVLLPFQQQHCFKASAVKLSVYFRCTKWGRRKSELNIHISRCDCLMYLIVCGRIYLFIF